MTKWFQKKIRPLRTHPRVEVRWVIDWPSEESQHWVTSITSVHREHYSRLPTPSDCFGHFSKVAPTLPFARVLSYARAVFPMRPEGFALSLKANCSENVAEREPLSLEIITLHYKNSCTYYIEEAIRENTQEAREGTRERKRRSTCRCWHPRPVTKGGPSDQFWHTRN